MTHQRQLRKNGSTTSLPHMKIKLLNLSNKNYIKNLEIKRYLFNEEKTLEDTFIKEKPKCLFKRYSKIKKNNLFLNKKTTESILTFSKLSQANKNTQTPMFKEQKGSKFLTPYQKIKKIQLKEKQAITNKKKRNFRNTFLCPGVVNLSQTSLIFDKESSVDKPPQKKHNSAKQIYHIFNNSYKNYFRRRKSHQSEEKSQKNKNFSEHFPDNPSVILNNAHITTELKINIEFCKLITIKKCKFA